MTSLPRLLPSLICLPFYILGMWSGAVFAEPNLSHLKPFLATPPYSVFVNGVSRTVNLDGIPRHHEFAGIDSLINPLTGSTDVATILAGIKNSLGMGNGVFSASEIHSKGISGRVEVVRGITMIAYRAGDFPVAGRCRTQVSSFAVPARRRVFWVLEFVLGDAAQKSGWPLSPAGVHPVTVWQLKAPDSNPSLSISVDTSPQDSDALTLIFGRKGGRAINVSRIAQLDGLHRYQPITVVMESYLDEREVHQGGQGYWRAWVNGRLAVDTFGPTLSAFAIEPHQWFLAVYLYKDARPLSDSWVSYWSQARLLVSD